MTTQLEALRGTLAEVDALLAQADKEKAELDARKKALDQEKTGLLLAINRLEPRSGVAVVKIAGFGKVTDRWVIPNPQTTTIGAPDTESWLHLDRTAAVERAMKELGRPADRNEVGKVLWRHGRTDHVDDISAALSYLRRKNMAERQKDGKWILIALALGVGAAALAVAAETS